MSTTALFTFTLSARVMAERMARMMEESRSVIAREFVSRISDNNEPTAAQIRVSLESRWDENPSIWEESYLAHAELCLDGGSLGESVNYLYCAAVERVNRRLQMEVCLKALGTQVPSLPKYTPAKRKHWWGWSGWFSSRKSST